MAAGYTENPRNFDELLPFVMTESDNMTEVFFRRKKCFFYDACSFQIHANLESRVAEYFLRYVKEQDGFIVITRCILMELASQKSILNEKYLQYIRRIREYGIEVLVIYEEDLFSVLNVCFSTAAAVNDYLIWAVRMIKSPAGAVTETLEHNPRLRDMVIKGRHRDSTGFYRSFFQALRKQKEPGDNLGEEVLGICLYLLSALAGEPDGKFCVLTDDKGAAGRIDDLFKRTTRQHRGKKICIFSTPKLVQVLYREGILRNRKHMREILETGHEGNLKVLGTCLYDLHNREMSLSGEELADLIAAPNGINIVF